MLMGKLPRLKAEINCVVPYITLIRGDILRPAGYTVVRLPKVFMTNPTPKHEETTGPDTGYIVGAVVLTALAGILLCVVEISLAEDYYRKAHALPDVEVHGFFSNSTESAPVTLDMLGAKTVLILVAIALVYSFLLHPLIGRVVSRIIHFLTVLVDSVYRLDKDASLSDWNSGASLVIGAGWPLTALTIPFLLIAIVIGYVYRALWRW
jgi:hypothetical protein